MKKDKRSEWKLKKFIVRYLRVVDNEVEIRFWILMMTIFIELKDVIKTT